MRYDLGRCDMNAYQLDVMIKKGAEIKQKVYEMMKNFQHNTSIPHLHFYSEGAGMGRLVIPVVRFSFSKWIKTDGKKLLFDEDGSMSLLFKTMTIDICDLVEKLYDRNILIKSLHMKNLYLAAETTPRILVLVIEAELLDKEVNKIVLWNPVKDIIRNVFKDCKANLNPEAARYLKFIGSEKFTVESLKKYPHNWDIQTKRDYLLMLISKQGVIKHGMIQSGISWPSVMPNVLGEIISYQSKKLNPISYNPKIALDYVKLIRDTYKHFSKFPSSIKRVFGSQDGFIMRVEQWSPDIWKDLYEMIGWQ